MTTPASQLRAAATLTLADLDRLNRDIWGDDIHDEHGDLSRMTLVLAKVVGDLAAQARVEHEPGSVDWDEVGKELGNLVLTSLRCLRGFGLAPQDWLPLAEAAQREYAGRMR